VTLAQLALDARAGVLDLPLHAGARALTTALEPRQVTAYVPTEPRELLLGLVDARVGLDGLDDVVTGNQRCAHRDQRRSLSLNGDGLGRELACHRSGLRRAESALGGALGLRLGGLGGLGGLVALARGSGLLAGGAALGGGGCALARAGRALGGGAALVALTGGGGLLGSGLALCWGLSSHWLVFSFSGSVPGSD